MTDFLSDDARLDPREAPAEAETSAFRLDRRSFLRALSGSALTLVAGGLTVTLAACQGAGGGGGSPSTTNVPFSGVGSQTPPSPMSSSFGFFTSSSSTTAGGSGASASSASTGSSGSTGSGSSTGSSGSTGSTSSGSSGSTGSASSGSSSSHSVSGALRRAAGQVNAWSTRV